METKTVRVYEEDYREIRRLSNQNDEPVREVVSDLLGLEPSSHVVGYCPEHGVKFTEEDVKSPIFGEDVALCPVKWQSAEGREFAHKEVAGGSNRIPVSELCDMPPSLEEAADDGDSDGEDSDDDEDGQDGQDVQDGENDEDGGETEDVEIER
jgi:cobalamin biosynthesis protein CobT